MVQSAKDGSIAFILDNYSGNDYFAIGARWGAGKKGGWCFSGSSTVETERGKIAIGDLRLGDNVLTLTPGTGAHYTEVIRQGLRCCTIPSLICQQKSYASQDAVKVLQDSPFYP